MDSKPLHDAKTKLWRLELRGCALAKKRRFIEGQARRKFTDGKVAVELFELYNKNIYNGKAGNEVCVSRVWSRSYLWIMLSSYISIGCHRSLKLFR